MSPDRVTITLSGEQSRSGLTMILVNFVCINRKRSVKTKPSSRLCWGALTDVIIFRSSSLLSMDSTRIRQLTPVACRMECVYSGYTGYDKKVPLIPVTAVYFSRHHGSSGN